jgi:hypothetical protein
MDAREIRTVTCEPFWRTARCPNQLPIMEFFAGLQRYAMSGRVNYRDPLRKF